MDKVYKNQGEVLIDLLKGFNRNDLKIAEIGVWKAQTVKRILKSCKDIISQYWAVDTWEPNNHWRTRHLTREDWDMRYAYCCRLMRWYPQLCVTRLFSVEAAKLFIKKYFDLVFIDAEHTYGSVMSDIAAWYPLVENNGLLVGHDYGGKKRGVKKAVDECFGEVRVVHWCWIKEGGGIIREVNQSRS